MSTSIPLIRATVHDQRITPPGSQSPCPCLQFPPPGRPGLPFPGFCPGAEGAGCGGGCFLCGGAGGVGGGGGGGCGWGRWCGGGVGGSGWGVWGGGGGVARG